MRPGDKSVPISDVENQFNRWRGLQDITIGDTLCNPVKDCPAEADVSSNDSIAQVV